MKHKTICFIDNVAGEWTENKDVGNLPMVCRRASARELYGSRVTDTEGWLLYKVQA